MKTNQPITYQVELSQLTEVNSHRLTVKIQPIRKFQADTSN